MARRRVLAFALVACAACNPELTVPPEAQISCGDASECPTGFQCATTIGRCVSATSGDTTAPSLSEPTFDRTLLNQGASARLTFTSSEPLFAPPTVILGLPTGEVALERDPEVNGEEGSWAYRYTALGSEPPDEAGFPVEISLVDAVGNQAEALLAGRLQFDFQAPEVTVTAAPAKSTFKAGDVAAISFTVSEPIVGAPLVSLSSGEVWTAAALGSPSTFTFEYVVPGTHPEVPDSFPVAITVSDAAGNVRVVESAATIAFDFTPPALLGDAVVSAAYAQEGEELTVDFEVTEALAELPGFSVGGVPGFSRPLESGGYQGIFLVGAGQTNGANALALQLVDLAGNVTDVLLPSTVEVDTVAPVVASKNVPPGPYRDSSASPSEVTFSFTLTEAVVGGPNVELRVDGVALAATCTEPVTPLAYECAFTMPNTPFSSTTGALAVSGTDVAGNVLDETLGTLTFDFTAPGVRSVAPIELVPADDNPNEKPMQVRMGTTVRARFSASEPVSQLPQIWAQRMAGGTPLPLTITEGEVGGQVFVAELLAAPDIVQGAYEVRVTARDDAGNESPVTAIGGFVVDTAAPTAVNQAALRYVRFPWGDQFGTIRFEVEGDASAVEAGSWVQILDAHGTALATTRADTLGGFTTVRLHADFPSVYVAQIDAAGNRSAPELIKEVKWTATLGSKVAGSTGVNPHFAGSRSIFVGSLFQDDLALPAGLANVALAVESPAQHQLVPGAGYFRRLHSARPPRLHQGAMAFDAARGRTVLFGGQTTKFGARDELWEWDGIKWQQRVPLDPEGDGNPSPRYGHAMTYDSWRGKIVLFGGVGANEKPNDEFWEFDGRSWKRVTYGLPSEGAPQARALAAMAFDSSRGELVIHGGRDAAGSLLSDTWVFHPLKNAWIELDTPGLEREGHTLTYDAEQQEVLLFGGTDGSSNETNELWAMKEWQWTKHDSAPPAELTPRAGHNAAYDSSRKKLVVMGGDETDPRAYEWGGKSVGWSVIEPRFAPAPRRLAAMVYDSARGEIVLFGGSSGGDSRDDTHKLVMTGKEPIFYDVTSTAATPPPRVSAGFAFDHVRDELVLFGGVGQSGMLGDTWSFDGYRWRNLAPAAAPGTLTEVAMAERVGQGPILFGGRSGTTYLADTWELVTDGFGVSTWSKPDLKQASPGARALHAMASVPGAAVPTVLLFGGRNATDTLDDTWVFNGEWSPRAVSGPTPRRQHAMAGARDGKVLLFGGYVPSIGIEANDTWLWDPASGTWNLQVPSHRPPRRKGHVLVFDPQRKVTLLFGGEDPAGNRLSDLWEWDGVDWREVNVFDPFGEGRPAGVERATAAYDPIHHRAVMFGGQRASDTESLLGETWVWDSGAGARAGHVFFVDLSSTRVERQKFTSAEVRFRAGGRAGTLDGVGIRIWDQNRWVDDPLAVNPGASPDKPDWVTATIDAQTLPRLLFGPSLMLPVAVTPLADSGSGAVVALDYMDVTITYTTQGAP